MKKLLVGSLIVAMSTTQVLASENCADFIGNWKCSLGENSGIITIAKSEKRTKTEQYRVDDGMLPYKAECIQKDDTAQLVSSAPFSMQTAMEIKDNDTLTISAYMGEELLMAQECDRLKE